MEQKIPKKVDVIHGFVKVGMDLIIGKSFWYD